MVISPDEFPPCPEDRVPRWQFHCPLSDGADPDNGAGTRSIRRFPVQSSEQVQRERRRIEALLVTGPGGLTYGLPQPSIRQERTA